MPIIRKDLHGQVMGLASGGPILYDPRTLKDLRIGLSVDITDECHIPEARGIKRVRLDFAKVSHGKIVVITKCYKPKTDKGTAICYTLRGLRKMDMAFQRWAGNFGLKPERLRTIIRRYAKRIIMIYLYLPLRVIPSRDHP